jgi:iron complex outermembrane receptor protein
MKHSLLLLAGLPAALFAQSAVDHAQETLRLSPFEVKSSSLDGYLSAEASTGSRYAAPVLEIPFPVQVITSEFIENFQAFDFSDAVAYTSSFTPTEGTGAFNLRGIRNFSHYKNGIREGGVYGPSSVDRIEVIKGPNAAMYGATEPTGLRNIVTKKAGPRAASSVRVTGGTDEFRRVAIDMNQPIIKGVLMTRFAGSTENSEQYVADFAKFRREVLYNSTTWNITDATSLTVNAEYIKFRSQAQNAADLPFVRDTVRLNNTNVNQFVGRFGVGDYEDYDSFNLGGPWGYNEVRYGQFDGTLSHQFNGVLSLRVLGNYWERDQDILRTTNYGGTDGGAYNKANGSLLGTSTPRLERNRQYQANAQADLLAHFRTPGIEHKLLLTADYMETETAAQVRTSSRADATFTLNRILTHGEHFNATFPYSFAFDDTAVWNNLTTNELRGSQTRGIMLSERAAFLDGKLIAFVGGRHDQVRDTLINYRASVTSNDGTVTPAGQKARFKVQKANTVQSGLLYRLTPRLSAFANYSESFNVQRSDVASNVDELERPLDPQRGSGYEIGLKGSLLDERLNFTIGYFDIEKTNNPRVARNASGGAIVLPSGRQYSVLDDITSKGIEVDFNWRVTNEFTFFGGFGWNKARYAYIGNPTEQHLVGVPPASTPDFGGGVAAEYRFRDGKLKGFSTRLGVRYQGEMLVNASTHSIYGNSGIKGPGVTAGGQLFDTYYFSNDAYWLVDLGFAYSWKERGSRFGHRVMLDFKNLLEEKYLRGRKPGDPFAANIGYELKF